MSSDETRETVHEYFSYCACKVCGHAQGHRLHRTPSSASAPSPGGMGREGLRETLEAVGKLVDRDIVESSKFHLDNAAKALDTCRAIRKLVHAALAAASQQPPAAFVCPTCGPCVVDEDGCCVQCGADAPVAPAPAVLPVETPPQELHCENCGTPLDPTEEHPSDERGVFCDESCHAYPDEPDDEATPPPVQPDAPTEMPANKENSYADNQSLAATEATMQRPRAPSAVNDGLRSGYMGAHVPGVRSQDGLHDSDGGLLAASAAVQPTMGERAHNLATTGATMYCLDCGEEWDLPSLVADDCSGAKKGPRRERPARKSPEELALNLVDGVAALSTEQRRGLVRRIAALITADRRGDR